MICQFVREASHFALKLGGGSFHALVNLPGRVERGFSGSRGSGIIMYQTKQVANDGLGGLSEFYVRPIHANCLLKGKPLECLPHADLRFTVYGWSVAVSSDSIP